MLSAKNQQGVAVDWWFIYKTPKRTGIPSNQGFDFFYYDPEHPELNLSAVGLDQDNQALSHTLQSLFSSAETTGYISYNDEHANDQKNSSEKGHCKGVLAFDKASDSAFFLLHSTPRFPGVQQSTLPEDEQIFGQTFICITLPDYQTANRIAAQMLCQQNPQILTECSRLPISMTADEPLYKLFHGIDIEESHTPSTVRFNSRGGKTFSLIAKSRKWGKDFWLDLISPTLKADLVVETWRRGAVTPEQDKCTAEFDEDLLSLELETGTSLSYSWPYTKDHAKWATALKNRRNSQPWVCVADMNRMVSQEKRGGGSLCFQEESLWQALMNAEQKLHQLAL